MVILLGPGSVNLNNMSPHIHSQGIVMMKELALLLMVICIGFFSSPILAEDLTPPQLLDFEISPTTVDVTQTSQIVTVTMHITDDESGVVSPNVTAGSDRNSASTGFASVRLVSGDNLDGIWEATLTVPQGTTSGDWSVSLFPLRDNADNSGNFGPP